ncbi:hypothetical protein EDB81DRAFT_479190 [Dactylonectria macrodidyma]|uniref:Secreted protein n=1 Tax=Dactylonectria macrodidyma TaxID=307937 RepID=A0A9P9EZ44_9HYPO|nr:hypothetical protein EDB81DRAFT_479190 [Dactylonectria macrodidyma]
MFDTRAHMSSCAGLALCVSVCVYDFPARGRQSVASNVHQSVCVCMMRVLCQGCEHRSKPKCDLVHASKSHADLLIQRPPVEHILGFLMAPIVRCGGVHHERETSSQSRHQHGSHDSLASLSSPPRRALFYANGGVSCWIRVHSTQSWGARRLLALLFLPALPT